MATPIPISPEASAGITAALAERDIGWWPQSKVTSLDPSSKVATLEDGRTTSYDLFLAVPVHRAPRVVEESALAVDGWVAVDHTTFATRFENVYAIGDVTSAPVPRVGAIAEGEARTLADVLIHQLRGGSPPEPYRGWPPATSNSAATGWRVRCQLPVRTDSLRDLHGGIRDRGRGEGRVRRDPAAALVWHSTLSDPIGPEEAWETARVSFPRGRRCRGRRGRTRSAAGDPRRPDGTAGRAGPRAGRLHVPTYYVSLGDSYAVGYQPGLGATPGYMTYVARKTHLTLANFGCGGATTTSLLTTIGCPVSLPHTAGAVPYPTTTQAAAAEAFLTAHRGHIGLITVSIGGNDVTSCAAQSNPISCVAAAAATIAKNVSALAAALRASAGPRVPLIGLTYPDVILGTYVYPTQPPSASRVALAKASVVAFRSLINPNLVKAYGSAGGVLVGRDRGDGGVHVARRGPCVSSPYGVTPPPGGQRLQPDLVLRPRRHPRQHPGVHADRPARGRQAHRPAPGVSAGR